jgi:uncharacterized protein (TIGR02271 family)
MSDQASIEPGVTELIGQTLVDPDGNKIGKITDVYLDDATGQPEWLTVSTGMFGTKVSFLPLAGSERAGDDVRCNYTKEQVKDAPSVEPDGALSPEEEDALYAHYGVGDGLGGDTTAAGVDTGIDQGAGTERTADTGTDDAMTRSEEEVQVGTERREAGRARLRKYIVTEDVQTTVPVQREEVRVEREPITDENIGDATSGLELSEDEHEVVLSEEEVVVDKQVVPKERVRLDTDVVTEERQVSEEVRKEQIEMDRGTGGDDPR